MVAIQAAFIRQVRPGAVWARDKQDKTIFINDPKKSSLLLFDYQVFKKNADITCISVYMKSVGKAKERSMPQWRSKK